MDAQEGASAGDDCTATAGTASSMKVGAPHAGKCPARGWQDGRETLSVAGNPAEGPIEEARKWNGIGSRGVECSRG
jgi:hypothetical protein